jgi:diaminohydroxyphosphoribosylaminopyrimidine deaminase/5-amino-6-(5-phosphoribosylamino)uracil reductase
MVSASIPSSGEGNAASGSDIVSGDDLTAMQRALVLAASVRTRTSPNPWVGCVIIDGGQRFEGATEPPGGNHAEIVALAAAGRRAKGATLYTTLEPCCHHGLTPPCVEAIVQAGIARVVVGLVDPDPQVSGRGIQALRDGGVDVTVGVCSTDVAAQLAAYLKHRRTGRPWVVLKLAASLDGRIAAPDGSSRWLTGDEARADAHRLRAESDAIVVGAATVRADDPQLTVRTEPSPVRQPLRVVLGRIPPQAQVHPALELAGELADVLDELGGRGVVQMLVEGGARVAHAFHSQGLIDRYVLYLAPALFGGDDGIPMFSGSGAAHVDQLWRGSLVSVRQLGADLRVELAPVISEGVEEAA